MVFKRPVMCVLLGIACMVPIASAMGQPLPGPADVGRVRPESYRPSFERTPDKEIPIPPLLPSAQIPEGAKNISFQLRDVRIEGGRALPFSTMQAICKPYIGKKVTLDAVWTMASKITERYQESGYFLSRAYVPQQHIKNGVVVIHVVEGYIGKIELESKVATHPAVKPLITRLSAQRPITSKAMESFLLRLNDLPGFSFRAILSQMEGQAADEGAIALMLTPSREEHKGSITFNNSGSRFLGPNQLSASYRTSLLPFHRTNVSALTSMPTRELRFGTVSHVMAVAPNTTVEMNGGVTKAKPGFSLRPLEIDSSSTSLGAGVNYQVIRQRQENLVLKAAVDGRNTDSEILGTRNTRDRIRAMRATASYDTIDRWQGYNTVWVTASQGVDGFGASSKNDPNISRVGAKPNFSKAELAVSHLHQLAEDWSLLTSMNGQIASGTLYSAEQFGYGGQTFGRAYDSSEITGDEGVTGALELRYGRWGQLSPVAVVPYVFYDAGKVWNEGAGGPEATASSAGVGMHFAVDNSISGTVGLAIPLTREAENPIYGAGSSGPRVLLEVKKDF